MFTISDKIKASKVHRPSLDSQALCFTFLTYGDITSAAYNRAKLLGSELADLDFKVQYVIDKSADNICSSHWWASPKAEVIFVRRKPHIFGVLSRRRVLRKSSRNGFLIVQLNPYLKAFLSLVGLRGRVICEWDEPPIFRTRSKPLQFLTLLLHKWFLTHSEFNVSCTKYFQRLNKGFAYIPHGYYLPINVLCRTSIGDYAAYMGNLKSPWDHDLIFFGALALADQGIKPPIHIIGSGSELEQWKEFCLEHSLGNIIFLGRLDDQEMQKELASAKVLLNPMRNTLLNQTRCSSKLLAYAQSGRPVIAHKVGEAEALLGQFCVGVEPGDSIMDCMVDFMNNDNREYPLDIMNHSYQKRASDFVDFISNSKLKVD